MLLVGGRVVFVGLILLLEEVVLEVVLIFGVWDGKGEGGVVGRGIFTEELVVFVVVGLWLLLGICSVAWSFSLFLLAPFPGELLVRRVFSFPMAPSILPVLEGLALMERLLLLLLPVLLLPRP